MSRPKKLKIVNGLPEHRLYGPINASNKNSILMSIEEYETIRLIDVEGLRQEECAQRMHVGRITVQKLYRDARYKIADLLVNGIVLKIEGGSYQIDEKNE